MEHSNRFQEPAKTTALVPLGRHKNGYPVDDEASGPYYSHRASDEDSEGGNLIEYFHILRRHKWGIILSAVGMGVLGILIGLPMTPIYEASTALEVLNVNENFMNSKETSPVTTTDFSDEVSEEETQVALLESDSLQDRVFARLDPNYSQGKLKRPASSGWRHLLHLSAPDLLTERERLLYKASLSLKVKTTPRSAFWRHPFDRSIRNWLLILSTLSVTNSSSKTSTHGAKQRRG